MRKVLLVLAGALALAMGMGVTRVSADDSATAVTAAAPGAQAQASEASARSTILGVPTENLYLSVTSTFHGPRVADPLSVQTIDRKGKVQTMGLYFDTDMTPAYMVTKDIGVGATVPFLLVAVKGGDFIMGDAGAKFFHKHIFQSGGFNVSSSLYLQAPTSTASQDRGLDLGVKLTPAIRYAVPGSRFTFGAWTEAKWYAGVEKEKTFKLWAAPYVNYKVLSNLSANLQYEMEAHHYVGDTGYFNFTNYMTNLQPGFVWNISSKVFVNPYVRLFTGNKVNSDTIDFGTFISASVL